MQPLQLFLGGTASWFLATGMQSVMFAWLVTIVLFETPEKVGVAQMTLLLPGLILMLVGGSLADHHGTARVAFVAQLLGVVPVIGLAILVAQDALSFSWMLLYAASMGCVQALVTPARDGLLSEVAGGRIQRTVMLAGLMQFGCQIIGVTFAGFAQTIGASVVLGVQALVLAIGAVAFAPLARQRPVVRDRPALLPLMKEGAATVWKSKAMQMVCLQNIAMGVLFMGSFIVTMPLLVREVFAGSADTLSMVYAANALGLAVTIALLLRFGDILRQGRALVLSQGVGAVVLAIGGFTPSLGWFVVVAFFWGMCGGVAMTMSRTIMQEQAPENLRARVMSFYSLTFMGAGPIGALLAGFMVRELGPQLTLATAAAAMGVFTLLVAFFGPLWRLRGHSELAPA